VSPKRPVEKFLPVSEQAKAWSSALAAELQDWPQVTLKSFFGFTALYRGKYMFGLLPKTKSVFTENALAFRIEEPSRKTKSLLESDARVAPFDKHKVRWYTLELTCDADLHRALDWFAQAVDYARKRESGQSRGKKARKKNN